MSCIICGEPNPWGSSFCPSCDEREQRRWEEWHQEQQQTTVEELCEADGHPFYAWDEEGCQRCYCGERRVFNDSQGSLEATST